jgi:hypothetical protein
MNTRMSDRIVNAQAKIVADLLHNGFLDFFDGTQPDNPETPIDNQVLLGSVRFTGFTEPKSGIVHALPIDAAFAIETGIASWARCTRADHRTPVMDVSVGERDANCIVKSAKVERGMLIELEAFEHEVPKVSHGM